MRHHQPPFSTLLFILTLFSKIKLQNILDDSHLLLPVSLDDPPVILSARLSSLLSPRAKLYDILVKMVDSVSAAVCRLARDL